MSTTNLMEQLARLRVVPVVAVDRVESALPLADALLAGGLPIVEVTFRTPAAAEVIQLIRDERPQMLVGAGTVLTAENVEAAHRSGAQFAVAPGLNRPIVEQALAVGLPFIPGVATPSEIESAIALGCTLLKFFPAGALGGVEMLQALAGPYRHTGVRFMPTGGVNAQNKNAYLASDDVVAVGGTWIARSEDIASGAWEQIRSRCQEAIA
jgi:2-dehydro-3-deoxyphosphogluconate aldolase/(4S)-4-hydroxy-2-oxoglutarate aldolase